MPDSRFHTLSNLRAMMEGFGASHAARRAGESGSMGELRAVLEELVGAVRRRDSRGYREADTKLHEAIMRMADVPGLPGAWKAVWDEIVVFYRQRHDLSVTDWRICVTEHEYLVEVIGLGDSAAAEEAARNHAEATYARVMSARHKDGADGSASAGTSLHLAEIHMASHLQHPLRLGYIASKVAFTSAGNLSRLFRRRHGAGFKAHLQRLRMEKAAELLAGTRLPVATVARRVGYLDGSLFARHFARHHGLRPRDWRTAKKAEG
ncbi:MAG: helix-turn-helix domain-containing protein [Opitutaceae bacterium]|jgi:AraC-like DNA-binding protein|nr:helix-turn-helix domain-containing protein [Opitutaceae bacterium]